MKLILIAYIFLAVAEGKITFLESQEKMIPKKEKIKSRPTVENSNLLKKLSSQNEKL